MKAIHSYLRLVTAFAISLLVHTASAQTATMSAPSRMVRAEEPASPWINLHEAAKLSRSQGSGSGQPIALASADFDEDGVPDLVTSYSGAQGGHLSVRRGNVDAIYPNSPDAQIRRQRGEFTDAAFLAEIGSFPLPEAADLVGAGDFDADGHWDIVAARTGGDKLFWLRGDGHGNFSQAQVIELHGTVTALVTGEMNRADGLTDIAVAVITSDGPRVWVFECPEGALRCAPEGIKLSASASAMALGQLDDDHMPDLAIASGNEVTIVHGRDRKLSLDEAHRTDVKAAQLSRTVLPSAITSIAIGDFAGDSRPEIAVLTADAKVRVLERRSEKPGNGGDNRAFQASDAMTLEIAENASSKPSSMRLLAAKVSSLPKDDLVIFGGSNDVRIVTTREADVFDKSGKVTKAGSARMSIAASLPSQSEVTAVLPMRLNADALKDLVLLNTSSDVPLVVVTQPAATFVVNIEGNTNDINPGDGVCADANGNCSFNAALQEANAHPGADTINFNIPGGGVHTLTHGFAQYSNEAVTIDGTTQPDGRIEIVANGDYPVVFFGGNSVLRGFAAYGSNVAIILASNGNIVEGNYVGFRADGTMPGTSGSGITFRGGPNNSLRGDNNLIGGTTAQARNVISNCALALDLSDSIGNVFQGNYIGTNVAGTAAFSNATALTSFGGDVTIGGTTSGAGNLISGNGSSATLYIATSAAIIQGNLIGTTADGTQPIANSGIGVEVSSGGRAVTIGGTTSAARNVIAANGTGIVIHQDDTGSNELVQGNFIGTNSAGTGALPNVSHGIELRGSLSATIGGVVAGAGNLISGNVGDGISVGGGINNIPSRAVIQGNLIGTDANGVVAIPNTGNGIQLPSSNGTIIGGTSPEARNVISGNHANGIRLGAGASSNQIKGNYIGLNRFGTGALGNTGAGVFFDNFVLGNTVGGTESGSSNNIAFNGGAGMATVSGVSILAAVVANSIHDNGGLGIDLSNNGVTKNTPGSNSNFPVITSAETTANGTAIQGTLQNGNYTAGITYTLQFFSNASIDPSGYGEGQTYIGQTTLVTDGTTSPHPFSLTVTPAVAPGRFITAVASGKDQFNQDGYEYLSEFSFPARVTGTPTPENTPLLLHLATPNTGGNTGTSTVTIIGEGIQLGATVVLRRAGQPDIIGTVISISADGSSITVRFDLVGQLIGVWNIVVTNPGGPSFTLPGGYNVEAGREPQVWADLLGRTAIRPFSPSRFTAICGNNGNTDAYGVPLFIILPADAVVELEFGLMHIPRTAEMYVDPNDVPAVTQTPTDKTVALIVPVIPAGGTRTFSFTVVPGNHTSVTIKVLASSPLLEVIGNQAPPRNGMSFQLGTGANGAGGTQLTVSEAGQNCITSIIGNTVSCLSSFIPGSNCFKAAISTTNFLNTLGGLIAGDPQGAAFPIGLGQLFTATISTAVSVGGCVASVTPIGPLIDLVGCGLSVVSTLIDCAPAGGELLINIVKAHDPNDKVGSHGSGAPQYLSGQEPFRYSIYFENQPTATAPAQEVVITDQLDVARVDLSTFQLGPIAFGQTTILSPPPGASQWTTEVDLRPGNNLIVRVIAALDQTTGLATWHFFSLDPVTRQPTQDPLAGFLPPNQNPPEGDGVVTFTAKVRGGQATGTQINNQARVIFDTNPPIDTPTWLNTIDNSPPSSAVHPLPATSGASRFEVSWSGTDTGAGITGYTIFVSVDGGAYTIWLENTSLTSAFFDGIPGRTYSFYSVARDGAGNLEAPPGPADTTTTTPVAGDLLNISTRLRVQTGENVLIGGFIITGTDPMRVIIRGIGPSLAQFFPGALADPTLEVFQGGTLLASNDNWKESQQAEIEATGIPPSDDLESAIVRTLTPGSYTTIMRGKDNATGIGVVEAYDLNTAANSKLGNISTRGFVEAGDDVMIGGCILGGSGSTAANSRVVVRAIGPSLSASGIAGALQDPTLELKDANGSTVISNDDWQQSQQSEINASGLAPTDFRESAVITYLQDGIYTAIVRGKNNTTGVALVEVYNLQ